MLLSALKSEALHRLAGQSDSGVGLCCIYGQTVASPVITSSDQPLLLLIRRLEPGRKTVLVDFHVS